MAAITRTQHNDSNEAWLRQELKCLRNIDYTMDKASKFSAYILHCFDASGKESKSFDVTWKP